MEHTQCRSGFIGHSVLVQKYLFLFGFLLCTSASAFAATSIQIISQPGDYIGQGANQTFTTVTGNSFGSQAGVSFSAGGYNYDFEAATGILVVGEQSAATRYPFNDPGIPGLNVSGNGRGCNDLTGRFIVHELEFGAGTTINKAAIDFEQHCEDALPALFGFIRYNSTLGVLDQDADTVSDIQDNCPADDNADQLDTDGDKVGDACDPVLGTTLVTMQSSSPADWVGLGKSYQFTMASGGVYMSHDTDTGYAEVKAGDFTFEFSGVGVNPLAVGAYPGATRHPFNLSTEPGLSVSGEGRGCNQLVGSFNVLELVRGNDGMVKNFAADFIQYCDEGPALKGLVMFNSNLFAHAGAKLGSTVNFAGDVDADGFGDYVMGAPAYTVAAVPPLKAIAGAGHAQVVSGNTKQTLFRIDGGSVKAALGVAVAGNADVDGDGFDDVVVGANKDDDTANKLIDAGSVTVLYGPDGKRSAKRFGAKSKAMFGSSVALGDVNDDGFADVIVGAPKDDDLRDLANKRVDSGSVTLLSGEDLSEITVFYGLTAKAYAGTSVASGNIDAAPGAEVVIGSPNDDDLVGLLKDAGSIVVYGMTDFDTPVMKKYGTVSKAYFGKSVASADVSKDGRDDVVVGAPGDDAVLLKDAGSVEVFSGADGSSLTKKFNQVAKTLLGNAVTAGDVNNDGHADIIAGIVRADEPGLPKAIIDAGSVSVWSGNGYVEIATLYPGVFLKDYSGASVAAGDVSGDGKADVLVGVPGFDLPFAKPIRDVGRVEVISGAGL